MVKMERFINREDATITMENGLTALIADDTKSVRDLLKELLKMNGYSPTVAKDGKEALDYINKNPLPRLLVTDLMMPVIKGNEFLELLVQKQGLQPGFYIPILIVSGGGLSHEDFEKARDNAKKLYQPEHRAILEAQLRGFEITNFDEFVTLGKPFEVPDIMKRINMIKSLYEA